MSIVVRGVCLLGGPVQGARVGNTRRRTVAAKTAFGKELDLMTVDTDQEGELAAQYRVSLLPYLQSASTHNNSLE